MQFSMRIFSYGCKQEVGEQEGIVQLQLLEYSPNIPSASHDTW